MAGASFSLNNFRSKFNTTEQAFQNRFELVIHPPRTFRQQAGELANEINTVSMRCESIQFPARNLRSSADDNQYGPPREIVQGVGQFATITATFLCDVEMTEKRYFDLWQKLIYDPQTYNLNYYNEYIGRLEIHQLSRFGKGPGILDALDPFGILDAVGVTGGEDTTDETKTYGIVLEEVYPKTINAQDLNIGTNDIQRISVEFAYRYWEELPFQRQGISEASSIRLPQNKRIVNYLLSKVYDLF